MGLIKEPEGIDFIINSEPLTQEQEKHLSEFIARRKQEIAEMEKHERPAKASESSPGESSPGESSLESKRAKTAKKKRKSQQPT